jgi:hypothetical protein
MVAIGWSIMCLIMVPLALHAWLRLDDFYPHMAAAGKAVLFTAVAWLVRERVDQVAESFEQSKGWRRALPVIEFILVGFLVAIGGNVLVDGLIAR